MCVPSQANKLNLPCWWMKGIKIVVSQYRKVMEKDLHIAGTGIDEVLKLSVIFILIYNEILLLLDIKQYYLILA